MFRHFFSLFAQLGTGTTGVILGILGMIQGKIIFSRRFSGFNFLEGSRLKKRNAFRSLHFVCERFCNFVRITSGRVSSRLITITRDAGPHSPTFLKCQASASALAIVIRSGLNDSWGGIPIH